MCVTKPLVPLVGLIAALSGCQGHGHAGRSDGPAVPLSEAGCRPSKLYGTVGELWRPEGRLIDASFAGYHTGIDPIPDVPGPPRRVTEFGARGDDAVDDTAAFLAGIAATSGVLLVPAGRYIVSQRLEIGKSDFVLRGEGAGKTILHFPQSLSSLYGQDWSFSGGFITVRGTDPGPVLTTVTAECRPRQHHLAGGRHRGHRGRRLGARGPDRQRRLAVRGPARRSAPGQRPARMADARCSTTTRG